MPTERPHGSLLTQYRFLLLNYLSWTPLASVLASALGLCVSVRWYVRSGRWRPSVGED